MFWHEKNNSCCKCQRPVRKEILGKRKPKSLKQDSCLHFSQSDINFTFRFSCERTVDLSQFLRIVCLHAGARVCVCACVWMCVLSIRLFSYSSLISNLRFKHTTEYIYIYLLQIIKNALSFFFLSAFSLTHTSCVRSNTLFWNSC